MTKVALICGITGQDGAYLTNFLIRKGYIVHGIRRRSSLSNTDRINHFKKKEYNGEFFLHEGDLTDSTNITRIISMVQPDEIYNLAAMSHVHTSFETPEYTANVDGLGTLRILEAVRILGLENNTKVYQASTSELFGLVQEIPQNEKTPFYPRSPYGVAKMYGYWITVNYREAYNIFACNGILFNHESPLRGENFVSRKITRAAARIALGLEEKLYLGNLNAKRDWGHARDYVEAMWLILQQEKPEDYVIATGITTEVREFVKLVFGELGFELEFKGQGKEEKAFISACHNKEYKLPLGKEVLAVDPKYYRPAEVDLLLGDATKAKEKLGWEPKINLEKLVKEMVEYDLWEVKKIQHLSSLGYQFNKSVFE